MRSAVDTTAAQGAGEDACAPSAFGPIGRTAPKPAASQVQSSVTPKDLETGNEAHFSTQQPQAAEDARLPSPDADHRRPERSEAPAQPRPKAPRRLVKGPSKARFEEIFQKGRRVSCGFCRLIALPGTGFVGIATSKKTGSKPRRNRLKRRFQEALRSQPNNVDTRLDYILMLFPSAESASFPEIREELAALFRKVGERWESDWVSS